MTCSRAYARFSLALLLLTSSLAAAEGPASKARDASAAPQPVDAGSPSAARSSVDVASLLSAFAKMPGLEASFSEEKHIALLAKPLTSRGRLFFAHPGSLLRRVEAPELSEVVISKDSLRVRDKAGEQTMDLRARKDIRPFIESLTWILAGDRAALEKVYAISFVPETPSAAWQLSLKPKVSPLNQLLRVLQIRGRGMFVEQIEVIEASGDKTITRILSANPQRTFTASERKKLFGEGVAETSARPTP